MFLINNEKYDFIQAPKYSAEDLSNLISTCYKLNSLQLRALLSKYQPTPDEPRLSHELVDSVVRVSYSFENTHHILYSSQQSYTPIPRFTALIHSVKVGLKQKAV